jgi:hypothetical protein
MEKNALLNELFEEWLREYKQNGIKTEGFSKDGIINEDRFEEADNRILFVLRETNNFPSSNDYQGDLRRFLNETLKYQIWCTVGRWAYWLLNDFPAYHSNVNVSVIHGTLRQTAVLNLKKLTGDSVSDLDEINETSHRDRIFIKKEVEIIDPQVIVACGTWSHLVWLLDLEDLPLEEKPPFSYTNHRLCLCTRHPVRANDRETYNDLRKQWESAKKHEKRQENISRQNN